MLILGVDLIIPIVLPSEDGRSFEYSCIFIQVKNLKDSVYKGAYLKYITSIAENFYLPRDSSEKKPTQFLNPSCPSISIIMQIGEGGLAFKNCLDTTLLNDHLRPSERAKENAPVDSSIDVLAFPYSKFAATNAVPDVSSLKRIAATIYHFENDKTLENDLKIGKTLLHQISTLHTRNAELPAMAPTVYEFKRKQVDPESKGGSLFEGNLQLWENNICPYEANE